MEQFKKDIQLWYSRIQGRGKIILAIAAVGFLWLLFQLIWGIAGQPALIGGWVAVIINMLATLLMALVIAQFLIIRNMQRNYERNIRSAVTQGRKGATNVKQVLGRRNAGSHRSQGGNMMGQALQMMTQVSVEDLDKQYRPKPLARPTVVKSWSDIEEPGVYALESEPKAKVEIIDASDIGGGFFVGRYSTDGLLKDRRILTHRQTGEPRRFDTLRNAKKAISGKKKKPRRRRK